MRPDLTKVKSFIFSGGLRVRPLAILWENLRASRLEEGGGLKVQRRRRVLARPSEVNDK